MYEVISKILNIIIIVITYIYIWNKILRINLMEMILLRNKAAKKF